MTIIPKQRPEATAGDGLDLQDWSLDPQDWQAFGVQAHRMLDDMIRHLANLRGQAVWQPIPDATRRRFDAPLPETATDLAVVHDAFLRDILPFSSGNCHPRFMGW